MKTDIKNLCDQCTTCQESKPSKSREDYVQEVKPLTELEPMEALGTDLFSIGRSTHLVAIDRCSGFVMHKELSRSDTRSVVRGLEGFFNSNGWPGSLRSDGGPCYRSVRRPGFRQQRY